MKELTFTFPLWRQVFLNLAASCHQLVPIAPKGKSDQAESRQVRADCVPVFLFEYDVRQIADARIVPNQRST